MPKNVLLIDPPDWRVVDRSEDGAAYRKGDLAVIVSVATEADGRDWKHVSVSRRDAATPSWDELRRVKEAFVGDAYAVSVLPPRRFYVNIHPGVLHLFSPFGWDWPLPEFSRGTGSL